MYKKLVHLLDRLADLTALAGMALAILAMLGTSALMIVEIGYRWLLQSSTHLMELGVGYGMTLITFGPLAYSIRHSDLIRVVLVARLLKPRTRWLLEIAVNASAGVVIGFLCHHFWIDFTRNLARGTTTSGMIAAPLWVASLLILFGLVLLFITLVANTLALIGDPSRVPERTEPV